MKENRFIELLNLYVDHQIAPEEAAALEAEILRSPERRKTYRDYCRMQRACGMVFARARQQAAASFELVKSLQETERKIINFSSPTNTGWGTYTAVFGSLAAMAACLAFIFLRSGTPSPSENKTNFVFDAKGKISAPIAVVSVNPNHSTTLDPVFENHALAGVRDDAVWPERSVGTEWMQQVQLPYLQRLIVDDSDFEARTTLQQDNSRVFRGSRPIQGNVEFTAFQFQH